MHFSGETFYNRAFEQAEGNLIQEAKPLLRTPHTARQGMLCSRLETCIFLVTGTSVSSALFSGQGEAATYISVLFLIPG